MNMLAWQTRRRGREVGLRFPVGLVEVAPAEERLRPSEEMTLRFRLSSKDSRALKAIREARRSMIREEWTRGLADGEPSLADAVFSLSGVLWEAPPGDLAQCREKLALLVRRANRIAGQVSERFSTRLSPRGSSGFSRTRAPALASQCRTRTQDSDTRSQPVDPL